MGRPLTLSPTFISLIRFLASKLRTPSHGVDLHASKSSTLNWREGGWRRTHERTAGCVETDLDVLALDDARVGLGLHEPVLCSHGVAKPAEGAGDKRRAKTVVGVDAGAG